MKLDNLSDREKRVYAIANNALYFADSSDYKTALWEVMEVLNPDLDEYAKLDYIEESEG